VNVNGARNAKGKNNRNFRKKKREVYGNDVILVIETRPNRDVRVYRDRKELKIGYLPAINFGKA